VQRADACEREDRIPRGTAVAQTDDAEATMLMFKKAQLYIGFALAALAEIIFRVATH
jgi:hypothetical protein